jgi:hypothetical protein
LFVGVPLSVVPESVRATSHRASNTATRNQGPSARRIERTQLATPVGVVLSIVILTVKRKLVERPCVFDLLKNRIRDLFRPHGRRIKVTKVAGVGILRGGHSHANEGKGKKLEQGNFHDLR